MIKYLENTTLHERQMKYYNGSTCPYCNNFCDFVDSSEVYQQSYGMIFICRPCRAWVNVHNQSSDQAFGFVAKKDLRDLRHEAHKWYDGLWHSKLSQGISKRKAQVAARKWMSEFMQVSIEQAHIGMMDNEDCLKLIEECKKWYLTPEQKAEKEKQINLRIEVVNFLSGFMGFEVNHFKVGALNKMELKHPSTQKIFEYYPVINTGIWQGKKGKPKSIEDIEKFIEENFKTKINARSIN